MNLLPDARQEAIANYQAITETWDTERAVEILTKHDWDVTKASNEFFFSNNPNSNRTNNSAYSEDSSFDRNFNNASEIPSENYQGSRPNNPPRYRNNSWENKLHSIFASIWKTIVPEEIRGENSKAAYEFSQKMTEICRAPVSFNCLEFSELLVYCFEQEKLLFLYLHGYSEDYPKEVFSDNRLVALLNKEFVYWGVNVASTEGKKLSSQLALEIFPCYVVIKVENPKKPLVLEKNSGYLDSRQILRNIGKFTSNASQELIQERLLREIQQEELKEAERLALQREKEKNDKIVQEKQEAERKTKELEEKKANLIARIGHEPEEGPNIAQVSFKLPSGKRVDRRFQKSEKVQVLYDYLEFININNIELITGVPSKVLQNRNSSLETEGVYPKSVVHVRELYN